MQGVAEALIRWGTDRMDEFDIDSCGEATAFSRPVLEKWGYIPVQYLDIKLESGARVLLSEEGRGMLKKLERERLLVMWRPREGKRSVEHGWLAAGECLKARL